MAEGVAAGLAETIRALRGELTEAMAGGADEMLRFQVGTVDLELTLAITRDASTNGGVRLGVVSFGAKGGISSQDTHRVKLSLQPVVHSAHGVTTPAEIHGQAGCEPA